MRFNTYSHALQPDESESRTLSDTITYHPEPQQRIDVLDDACFYPHFHCLYDREGRRVDDSLQWRDRRNRPRFWPGNQSETQAPPADIAVFHHPVIYLGVLFTHYGHFVLECTARLWAIRQLIRDDGPVKFLYSESSPGSFWRDGYVAEFMHLASIPLQDFVFFDAPVRLRRVYLPHTSFDHETEAYSNHADTAKAAADRVLRGRLPRLSDQPLYISRTRYKPQPWEIGRQRFCLNEFALEEILRDAGFLICHAEMLSLHQKIVLYNSHRFIVGHRGSGLLTTMFSLNGKDQEVHNIYEAGKAHGLLAYTLVDLIAGMTAYYIGTALLYIGDILAPDRHPDQGLGRAPEGNLHRIDLEQTLAWLSQRGLLNAAPPSVNRPEPVAVDSGSELQGGSVVVHLLQYGDTTNEAGLAAGRRYSRRYITGLNILPAGIPHEQLEYQVVGDDGITSDWVGAGTYCGTRGLEKPLLGFAVRLRGEAVRTLEIRYAGAFIGVEELVWAADGEPCRAAPDAPLEAFKIFIEARASAAADLHLEFQHEVV